MPAFFFSRRDVIGLLSNVHARHALVRTICNRIQLKALHDLKPLRTASIRFNPFYSKLASRGLGLPMVIIFNYNWEGGGELASNASSIEIA